MTMQCLTEEKFERRMSEGFTKFETRFEAKMDQKFDEFAIMMKECFDIVLERLDGAEQRLGKVEVKVEETNSEVKGMKQQLLRHMQITDSHYHELKSNQKIHQKWFKQLSRATKTTLVPPITELR